MRCCARVILSYGTPAYFWGVSLAGLRGKPLFAERLSVFRSTRKTNIERLRLQYVLSALFVFFNAFFRPVDGERSETVNAYRFPLCERVVHLA